MTTGVGCHVGGGIMTKDGGGGMTAGTSWTSERAIVAAGMCRMREGSLGKAVSGLLTGTARLTVRRIGPSS